MKSGILGDAGSKNRKPILLFIDEVDMLRTKNQDVLYKLFDWACNAEVYWLFWRKK